LYAKMATPLCKIHFTKKVRGCFSAFCRLWFISIVEKEMRISIAVITKDITRPG